MRIVKLHEKVFRALIINDSRCYECHMILSHVNDDMTVDLDKLPRTPFDLVEHLRFLYEALDLEPNFPELRESVAM